MKPSSIVIVAALLMGSVEIASARDHLELVCSAVADAKDGGDRVPLFVHLFEQRSADGENRDETVSTIYQRTLFQATRVNTSGELSKDAPIVLKAGSRIRFRGAYTLAEASGAYVLKLAGKIVDDPSARKLTYRAVAATLPCVNLSI